MDTIKITVILIFTVIISGASASPRDTAIFLITYKTDDPCHQYESITDDSNILEECYDTYASTIDSIESIKIGSQPSRHRLLFKDKSYLTSSGYPKTLAMSASNFINTVTNVIESSTIEQELKAEFDFKLEKIRSQLKDKLNRTLVYIGSYGDYYKNRHTSIAFIIDQMKNSQEVITRLKRGLDFGELDMKSLFILTGLECLQLIEPGSVELISVRNEGKNSLTFEFKAQRSGCALASLYQPIYRISKTLDEQNRHIEKVHSDLIEVRGAINTSVIGVIIVATLVPILMGAYVLNTIVKKNPQYCPM